MSAAVEINRDEAEQMLAGREHTRPRDRTQGRILRTVVALYEKIDDLEQRLEAAHYESLEERD